MNKFSNDSEIKELINQYKEHECLWNIYSPNYKDKPLKQKAWSDIANYFNKAPNEVKRKIQYLRAAYVHEKKRVEVSKKSESRSLHKPSLFYYKEMDFLDSMVIFRKLDDSKDASNIFSESIGSSQDFEVKDFIVNRDDYIQEPELNCKLESWHATDFDSVSSTPKESHSIEVKPNKTASLTSATKPHTKYLYYSFGKTIALQLQHLPLEDALLAMSEIQNIMTMKSLDHIRSIKNDNGLRSESETDENCNEFNDENYKDFF